VGYVCSEFPINVNYLERINSPDDEDNGSDCESDYSEGSDTPMRDANELDFVDIAKRPSTVQSDTNPATFLDISAPILNNNNEVIEGPPLRVAISLKDSEALKTVLGLYSVVDRSTQLPEWALDSILGSNSPEMLDVLIRKTGWGLDLGDAPEEPITEGEDKNCSSKAALYLGLDVHGKKRKDLASHSDPNSRHGSMAKTPMLWKAIRANATSVIEYLASNKVIDAYATFAKSNDGDSALQLRRVKDLHSWIPERLGWGLSRAGESPLIAAASAEKASALKILFELVPEKMARYLNEK
jgi:hypothetical protein